MDESASASGKPAVSTNNKNTRPGGVTIGGFLETSKSERSVWLMKCPSLVSHSLRSPSSDDISSPVAKVIVSVDPLNSNADDSSTQFTMELAAAESGNTPKSYTLAMSKDFVPMSVFAESSQGQSSFLFDSVEHEVYFCKTGKVFVEGKILNKFDVKPHSENLEKYGKLCRERTKKYMTKNRQVQVIDNDNGTHMRPMPGMMTTSFSVHEKKKPPAKASDTKRTRRDRGEMEDIMFKLFERQPNWTLRQLIQETDQPELFLKDILKELCVYNNKGSNQGSYELKPEYKKSSEDPATSK
ncbi:Transcription initiation factor IIF subunit beta [Linum perenne]